MLTSLVYNSGLIHDAGRQKQILAFDTGVRIVEISDRMAPGHVSLPNGTGIDYTDADGRQHHHGVAPNELTDSYRRDFLAGTPWHKHVPAKLEKVAGRAESAANR